MSGTLLWIIKGTTFIDAPNIEQMPVAVKDKSPIFLERRVDVSDKINGLVLQI